MLFLAPAMKDRFCGQTGKEAFDSQPTSSSKLLPEVSA
jgi:hypothetical protein